MAFSSSKKLFASLILVSVGQMQGSSGLAIKHVA